MTALCPKASHGKEYLPGAESTIKKIMETQANLVANFLRLSQQSIKRKDLKVISQGGNIYSYNNILFNGNLRLCENKKKITQQLIESELRKLSVPEKEIKPLTALILNEIQGTGLTSLPRKSMVDNKIAQLFHFILKKYGHAMLADIIKAAGFAGGFENSFSLFTGKKFNPRDKYISPEDCCKMPE